MNQTTTGNQTHDPLQPALGANPVGSAVPFTTNPAHSGNENGNSETSGLSGTTQKFDDGTVVTDATEQLKAKRTDGLDGSLLAHWRRVQKENTFTIRQENYSYAGRILPDGTLFLDSGGLPSSAPDGFTATAPRTVIATQFGKGDKEDEGTGSPTMGTVQTNSDVVGGSVKISIMVQAFGANWRHDDRRLKALIEVFFDRSKRMVRVPLVDIGPGENAPSHAEVDPLGCDKFLMTQGRATVQYRLLFPV